MSQYIKEFISKSKPQFEKYKKYIIANDWAEENPSSNFGDEYFNNLYSEDLNKVKKAEIEKLLKEKIAAQKTDVKVRTSEFNLQNKMMLNIVERIKRFVSKTEGEHHLKDFKAFIKFSLSIIKIHTDRVDDYVDSVDVSKIDSQEVRSEEMNLIKECFEGVNKIQDIITGLNIKDDATDESTIVFHENTKIAQLCMHEILYNEYPLIKRIIDSMKLDWDSPPKNEMHIHNPSPPKWNPEKHYFLQDKATLQYYIDEYKKLENGIVIDGLEMEPWLYFHINHFVTEIPTEILNKQTGEKKIKKIVQVPQYRDNEHYIIQDNYREARKNGKILFIAATRRLFKSTGLASHLYHKSITGGKELLVAGGSAKDLGQLEKNIKVCASFINPAFAVNNISSDWTKKIPLGIRTKSNKILTQCIIHVINLDGGNNSEILAGFTPDALVIDEVLKSPFIDQLNGAKPSFDTPNGMLCCPILSGTGGDEEMSRDGHLVLNDPKAYKVHEMNWDALERGIDKEDILWVRRDFGTFAPAAMSAKTGMIKIKSNLAKYLNRPDSKELEKIEILVTDWKRCNEIIAKDREKLFGDKKSLNKEIVYYPNDPQEIFASGAVSPFPLLEAKAHKEYLLKTGLWDRRRDLYRDTTGKICSDISTKALAEFPHKGGNISAPFLIFEDLPKEKPKFGAYTAGFDDYKQEDSDTSSLATFYVVKNQVLGDPFSNRIVASLKFRPDRHSEVYEKWLLLMEAYNLERTCFGENEDFAIKDFLDKKHLTETYLAPSLDFSQTFNVPNNMKRRFGWSPSSSKRLIFNMFVDHCNETFDIEQEDGTIKSIKGVQTIDDIGLLDEIIQYTPVLNVDAITSAMAAFAYGHYLRSSHLWKVKERQIENLQKDVRRPNRTKTFYSDSGRSRSFYRGR